MTGSGDWFRLGPRVSPSRLRRSPPRSTPHHRRWVSVEREHSVGQAARISTAFDHPFTHSSIVGTTKSRGTRVNNSYFPSSFSVTHRFLR